MSFGFFSDSGLTVPATAEAFNMFSDGSAGDQDVVLYFGSADPRVRAQDAAHPGSSQLTAGISLSGTPLQPATIFKLAATQGGLGAGGQSLGLGVTVPGGAGNAAVVWLRCNLAGGDTDVAAYPPGGSSIKLEILGGFVELAL